ncbi:MAG: SUF system NifU family Fe-S cluster assembly protein [Gammaproteobacteria bacterium]|nr:MAG: SUF system NifU family Fe-S cluster assembly protein [Gammaproteobacteria bacterium]
MLGLEDLYQEIIVDHNRSPRNFRKMDDANHQAEGYNPLCGDQLTLYLKLDQDERIEDVSFQGSGCAISVASASLMTQMLKGKTRKEAEKLFTEFTHMATSEVGSEIDSDSLGKLAALAGVREFPARVKCATLCWHTLETALHDKDEVARTE